MTPKEAYTIIRNKYRFMALVECVDLDDEYGFVFVDWDRERDGELTRDKAYKLFFISGWATVDKKTKAIGAISAAYYYADHPEKMDNLLYIPVSSLNES